MSNEFSDMGKRIQKRRKNLKMNQSTLAEALGISPTHMSTIENGKQNINYKQICALCEALDITPDYLFLGNMHSNNISQNIIDCLKLCSDEDLEAIFCLVRYYAEKNN